MVDNSEITLIFTGSITSETGSVVNETASLYPGASIIISTFGAHDPSIPLPPGTRWITSPDPGPSYSLSWGKVDNLKRQVLLVLAALDSSTTKFVCKIRTDVGIVQYISPLDIPPGKIGIPQSFTRNPSKFPLLFHPSDIAQIGERETISSYWRASASELEGFNHTPLKLPRWVNLGRHAPFLAPEQRLCLNYARSLDPDSREGLNYASDFSIIKCKLSEKFLTEHFVLLSDSYFRFPTRFNSIKPSRRTNYTEEAWRSASSEIDRDARARSAQFVATFIANFYWWNIKSKIRNLLFK